MIGLATGGSVLLVVVLVTVLAANGLFSPSGKESDRASGKSEHDEVYLLYLSLLRYKSPALLACFGGVIASITLWKRHPRVCRLTLTATVLLLLTMVVPDCLHIYLRETLDWEYERYARLEFWIGTLATLTHALAFVLLLRASFIERGPDQGEFQPIVLRPRRVPVGSKRWLDWIDSPPAEGGRVVLGYLLTLVALVLGLGVIVAYILIKSHSGRGPGAVVLGMFAGIGSIVYAMFRLGRRVRARHAVQALRRDPRPPLLLLRAFRDDETELPGFFGGRGLLTFGQGGVRTFEEFLYDVLARCGPVIAIGRPGETLPPLGASRFWVRNDRWKAVVDELLGEVQYVVLIMGRLAPAAPDLNPEADQFWAALQSEEPGQGPTVDDGLTWEVKRLLALKGSQKVILIMPPLDEPQAAGRWRQYREILGTRLPPYRGGEVAALLEADGVCRVARVRKSGWLKKRYHRGLRAYQSTVKSYKS